MGSVDTSQLWGTRFNPEIMLLSVWSLCACSPCDYVGFLEVLCLWFSKNMPLVDWLC